MNLNVHTAYLPRRRCVHLDAEALLTLLAALIIGLVIAEYGAYRAEKRIKKGLAGAGSIIEKQILDIEEHPEKHPRLAKAYKLYLRLCDVAENVLDEVEEETKKQQEKTKKEEPTL